MKKKLFYLILIIFCFNLVSIGFSDPVNPPPPPPVTSYTYTLTDEFKSCGPQDNWADFCVDYYSRQKVVISGTGVMTENKLDFVCGKDIRCENGKSCFISNPNDNTSWKKIKLNEDWICPDGYGLAQLHQPGVLDPNFDTVSFSSNSIDTQSIAFLSNSQMDLYFNSYIPACVNRIPMMNFNPKLKNLQQEEISQKVGLYVKHETLSYDANPTGGKLENFYIPNQENFRETFSFNSDLKTYRMWSFRERFVEGLQRIIDQKNLQIPNNIDVDSLPSNSAQDFEKIYFSRDYMMGAYRVEEDLTNNVPVGEDLVQTLKFNCNLDVNDLGISSIKTNLDLEKYLEKEFQKEEVINILKNNPQICNLNDDIKNIIDLNYLSAYDSFDTGEDSKKINFDIRDISTSSFSDIFEFTIWKDFYPSTFSSRLRNIGELSSEPREDYSSTNNIKYEIKKFTLTNLDPSNFNCPNNDVDCLIEKIEDLEESDLKDFSKTLINKNYLNSMHLVKEILKVEVGSNPNRVKLEIDAYTRNVEMDINILLTSSYEGFALIEVISEYETSTESSWNWRTLESLTLTHLARCLYNWDECLLNSRNQIGTNWQMSEVADLGYGPVMNSLAYIWSAQILESEYEGLEFGYHFDGARGLNSVNFNIAVYKRCSQGETWISNEKYYACFDGFIYKCHYGISLDENRLGNIIQANVGNTIQVSDSFGFVCMNSLSGYKWEPIACYS